MIDVISKVSIFVIVSTGTGAILKPFNNLLSSQVMV